MNALLPGIPRWFLIASAELGVREVRGGENDRIIEYHQATTLRATEDEVPWCSAFMCWVMGQAGVASTRSAMARSWLAWGRECRPVLGAVVVLRRTDNPRNGHVGLLVGQGRDGRPWLLGGNQSDAVSIAPFRGEDVLGFRWPSVTVP